MSKGIKGDKIYKLIRIDDQCIHIRMKDGRVLEFKAVAEYGAECSLISKQIMFDKED